MTAHDEFLAHDHEDDELATRGYVRRTAHAIIGVLTENIGELLSDLKHHFDRKVAELVADLTQAEADIKQAVADAADRYNSQVATLKQQLADAQAAQAAAVSADVADKAAADAAAQKLSDSLAAAQTTADALESDAQALAQVGAAPAPAPDPGPAPAPVPTPDPQPVDPGPAPDPVPAPAPDPVPAPAPDPGPVPAPDPGPAPAPDPQPAAITPPQPVYQFQGTDPIDSSNWPTAPFVASDGSPLYYFSGDESRPDATPQGVGNGWVQYTGSVTEVPAS